MTTEGNTENAAILNYLRKMGYRQTERLFREEAHVAGLETVAFELRNEQDSNIANYLLFANNNVEVSTYDSAYEGLRKWAYESLDAFRDELIPVLYPLFVHCVLDMLSKGAIAEARQFMEKHKNEHLEAHEDEMMRLSTITESAQLKENALATAFRTNKYNVAMSAYSFQLLMSFLQDGASTLAGNGNVLLLKIINQYINIRVLVSRPTANGASAAVGLTGVSSDSAASINRNKILWGANVIDPSVETALHQRAKSEGRLNEILQGALGQLKRSYTQASLNAPPGDRISKPAPGAPETNAEIDRLRHLARRAALSSTNLPSICFYTLHNSYDGVTSIDFSPTCTMLATGNRDSYIDIWSLNHEPLRAIRPSTELAAMDLTDFDSLEPMREFDGSMSKRLIGHSGSVYSCKFMHPDGQRFMISASQDGTARLWSLDTFSCIVIYRGHNAAVWDVDVAPLGAGPYFVTASADRTARLWVTENIQAVRIFAGHLSDVDVVRFHPNGNYVLTGSSDKTCRMWDIQNGSCIRLFAGHNRGVCALAISPDGRLLASGDQSGQLRLWDLAEGRPIKVIQPKPLQSKSGTGRSSSQMTPFSLEFDRDGRILASAGADQVVRIWDVAKLVGTPSSAADVADDTGLLATYPTKSTPITRLHFTYRNVLLGAGPFSPED
jgi:transcription initiation factor TFIID subunit 5